MSALSDVARTFLEMVRIALLLLTLLLVAAAPAAAQTCQAPPGTSAVDEYCETIPEADGDRGAGDPREAEVPAETVRSLERSGEEGQALNRLLGRDGAPARDAGERADPNTRPSAGPSLTTPTEPSANPLAAVRSAIEPGSTLGSGFVLVLLGVTILMAGLGWFGYRRKA
jgi:hypothetical protein